jgi:C-terminal processing protease CtpA/Prc
VSSVGGTLGSQTQATGAGTAMVEGAYSEDASFDAHYQDPNATVKEVALEVWAPPGKLGVVIDTPNDGAPVVHAIKDSSVIADKLQVGDRLIAVDDEDVQSMTAIKVSKLISRKSANATRKLSIIRQVVE